MYTGFKQADDPMHSIVPDGTVRFTGRGNLVVAPRTLLGQVCLCLCSLGAFQVCLNQMQMHRMGTKLLVGAVEFNDQ